MSADPLFSIVLPCYNPLTGWEKTITDNLALIKNKSPEFELIIVNDGSIKNFNENEVRGFFSSYPEVKLLSYSENRGKGYALRQGVKAAAGEIIIYTDVDFPYTTDSFYKIYNALADGRSDVAIGIRGEEYYTHLPRSRTRISKLLRYFIKRLLRIPTDDTQCGLKGFNQRGREVFLQTTIDRYLFDLEFIFTTSRKKLVLQTVEVQLRPEVQLSAMNWNILLQELGNFLKIVFRSKT